MKNLLKFPVLLLALLLVVSCGDSKKEKEEEKKLSPLEMATKVFELECESKLAKIDGDSEKAEKIDEEVSNMMGELRKILGDDPEEEIESSIEEAFREAGDLCSEKIIEIAISDLTQTVKLGCEIKLAEINRDFEEETQLREELREVKRKIYDNWYYSNYDIEYDDRYVDAKKELEDKCDEKIADAFVALAKRMGEIECEQDLAYSYELEEELSEITDIVSEIIYDGIDDDLMDEAEDAYERAKSNCGYNNFDSDEKRATEAVEAPAEEVFFTELLVDFKGSWDMNITISGANGNYYYSARAYGETRSLYEGEIPWQEIVEGNTYKVYYSPRNWVEDYETGEFGTANFIIRIELLDD